MTTNEDEKIPEDQMERLHAWIATIPFSKPSKNLARDFSDAVLMAEVLKVYYPRHVDIRNYVSANNVITKKENWNILNRKVLSKIDMKLSKDTMNQLANCHPTAIGHLLLELRSKLSKDLEHQNSFCYTKQEDRPIKSKINEESSVPRLRTQLIANASMFEHVKMKLFYVLHWLLLWFCIWRYFPTIRLRRFRSSSATPASTTQNTNSEDVVPRRVCAQLKQELREKDDIVSTLSCKVAYLENAMRVKDLRISSLASKILQNAVDSKQLTRNQTNGSLAKLRSRPSIVPGKIKPED